jgi:hypothetical protein
VTAAPNTNAILGTCRVASSSSTTFSNRRKLKGAVSKTSFLGRFFQRADSPGF